MKSKIGLFAVVAVLLSGAAWMMAGCETTSHNDEGLDITPGAVTLTNDYNWAVTFQAGAVDTNGVVVSTNLYYPLEWRVSYPALGVILSSAGNSAIYQSLAGAAGVNIVSCRDQAGREGSATVALTAPPPDQPAP